MFILEYGLFFYKLEEVTLFYLGVNLAVFLKYEFSCSSSSSGLCLGIGRKIPLINIYLIQLLESVCFTWKKQINKGLEGIESLKYKLNEVHE